MNKIFLLTSRYSELSFDILYVRIFIQQNIYKLIPNRDIVEYLKYDVKFNVLQVYVQYKTTKLVVY